MGSKCLLLGFLCLSVFLVRLEESFAAANDRLLSQPKPPPAEAAATARWLVSQSTWGVLSTISSELGGAPFGNVVSVSDGLPGDGRGIPYFYLTTLDPTARNAMKDVRSSFTLSEFPLGTCGKKDPENPTCSKLTLTGKVGSAYSWALLQRVAYGDALALTTFNIFSESIKDAAVIFNGTGCQPDMPTLAFSGLGTGSKIETLTGKVYQRIEKISYVLTLVDVDSEESEFAEHALFTKHPEMTEWPEDHDFRIFKLEIIDIFLIDWYGGAKPISLAQYLQPKMNKNAPISTM